MSGESGALRADADRRIEHPDSRWLDTVVAAAQAWRGERVCSPTNSLTGGGVIGAFEERFSALHQDRPALLVPSATYGLRLALQVVDVRAGDDVLVPALDWPSSAQAVTSLGANAIPVPVAPQTLTIDPSAAAAACTARTRAIIACHLHGVVADVEGLHRHLPALPIIEDCAAALGCTLDGRAAGALGDLAVFSLGPGKQLSAGEGGVVLSADAALHTTALTLSAHPLRMRLSDVDPQQSLDTLPMRGNPLTALLALHGLSSWSPHCSSVRHQETAHTIASADTSVRIIGGAQRTNTSAVVPVAVDDLTRGDLGSPSGACVIPGRDPQIAADAAALHQVTRLVRVPCAGDPVTRIR